MKGPMKLVDASSGLMAVTDTKIQCGLRPATAI